jgi:choline dehydrogenase-like flavoprotein
VVAEGHWGQALREYMRDYNHWTVLGALSELMPLPENRVTLASQRDQYGMPIACFQHSMCENDRKNLAYATKVMEEIWEGADAQDVLKIERYAHLVGGCRMGFSARDSVVDSSHRAWEVPNLLVADGSVFPTEGSANPALVIMALSDRLAVLLADKRVERGAAAEAQSAARRTRRLRRKEPASRS